MKKIIMVTATALMLTSVLGACGMNNKGKNNLGQESRKNMTNVNYNNRTNDLGYNNINNPTINENTRMDVADAAARKVTDLKEVKSATVITTDNNAYVAATLEGGESMKLTREIEKKIADAVKSTDSSINHVYVSTNPDFGDRMRGYADQINKGNPVSGFAKEFSETIRRVFPSNR
ncbi:YhcN/YlaJ family sporulation lipoprotein [Fictibacillus barbaricus]|uniref:YhcN/YlaJ family sporulation lipoprotein n=1 Tax=Fictibacillus barbaricus TaxID=182136 RepID=A0ABU1U0M7_9BACL|nr:YhcN/YlaJ family sporulation lipoprotein [Fictibacillus barbaricus]MDR7072981.1 YhcN/YlaJ family sporulation lipoprotein [Fictibacillus barbaricus]